MANQCARGMKSLGVHMEIAGSDNQRIIASINDVEHLRLVFQKQIAKVGISDKELYPMTSRALHAY